MATARLTENDLSPVDRGFEMPFTYAYLASAPHSGSTLLACLLAGHPEISSVGEFASSWSRDNLRCSCGKLYHECSFWNEWAERARKERLDFVIGDLGISLEPRPDANLIERLFYHQFPFRSLDRLRDVVYPRSSLLRRNAGKVVERSVKLARLLCRMQGTRVFFDTSKNPFQPRFLVQSPNLRLKTIALVRDGRGVVHSKMKHYGTGVEQAIREWVWTVRNMERTVVHYLARHDVMWLRLEDLCREPEATREAIWRFLDVDPQPTLDYSDASTRHITGNKMRYTFDGTIRCDDAWRKTLTPTDLRLFEKLAGRLNRRYGYLD